MAKKVSKYLLKSMEKQSLIIVAIIIFFIGAGVFLGTTNKMKDPGNLSGFSQGGAHKNISGVIQSISGNTVTVKVATSVSADTTVPLIRVLTINTGTKIRQVVQKDPTQLQKELVAYYEKKQKGIVTAGNVSHTPPPFEYTDTKDVPLSTLKIGQSIVAVLSSDNTDVASEILITPTAEALENMKQSAYQELIGAPVPS